jgi:hypothetical protein
MINSRMYLKLEQSLIQSIHAQFARSPREMTTNAMLPHQRHYVQLKMQTATNDIGGFNGHHRSAPMMHPSVLVAIKSDGLDAVS